MYDVIIIGAGPAGISCGLYLKRANKNILIIHNNNSILNKATVIENYYGIEKISGNDLYKQGITQAKKLGIEIINDDVIEINENQIITNNNIYKTKIIVLATGLSRKNPNIKNLNKYINDGISYCATCDGFFYKNKKVAVIGNSKYTINEANYLSNLTQNITILTNNLYLNQSQYNQIDKKIVEINKNDQIFEIKFDDNSIINVDGIFIALELGTTEIINKIGILTEKNKIVTNQFMETNVNNIYAIGDITDGILQIAKAVYQGAIAAENIIKKLA